MSEKSENMSSLESRRKVVFAQLQMFLFMQYHANFKKQHIIKQILSFCIYLYLQF